MCKGKNISCLFHCGDGWSCIDSPTTGVDPIWVDLLHLDDYIHKAASIHQMDKNRTKLLWMVAVFRFAFTIFLIIERHSAVRECTNGDASVYIRRMWAQCTTHRPYVTAKSTGLVGRWVCISVSRRWRSIASTSGVGSIRLIWSRAY
jgi:hypothetical protein